MWMETFGSSPGARKHLYNIQMGVDEDISSLREAQKCIPDFTVF